MHYDDYYKNNKKCHTQVSIFYGKLKKGIMHYMV